MKDSNGKTKTEEREKAKDDDNEEKSNNHQLLKRESKYRKYAK